MVTLSSLQWRILSSLILVPIVLLDTYLGDFWFSILVSIMFAFCMVEWWQMIQNLSKGGMRWILFLGGFIYLFLTCFALNWLRQLDPEGYALIFWLFAVVWGMDTGAFFVGSRLGGPKLLPQVSPKKTWSGFIGGLAVSAVAGYFAVVYTDLEVTTTSFILISIGLGAIAQAGDLIESSAKRLCGVKDSGKIIPGHGGFLDRVDGLLAASGALCLLVASPWKLINI